MPSQSSTPSQCRGATQVFVRDLNGRTGTFDAPATMRELAYAIWRRGGMPPPAQRFVFGNKQLRLDDAVPGPEATLHLTARLAPQVYVYFASQRVWFDDNVYCHATMRTWPEAREAVADMFCVPRAAVTCASWRDDDLFQIVAIRHCNNGGAASRMRDKVTDATRNGDGRTQ